jgi:hypothetical protein
MAVVLLKQLHSAHSTVLQEFAAPATPFARRVKHSEQQAKG